MKKLKLLLCFCLFSTLSFSQIIDFKEGPNLGFERTMFKGKLPDKWFEWGSGYKLKIDTSIRFEGKKSVSIESSLEIKNGNFGNVAYEIPANFEASEIELKAYLKLENVTDGSVGLLLRIDGSEGTLAFDNMNQRNIRGTSDWKQYSIKLKYPENAKRIYIGALLTGKGKIWVDNFEILIDGKDLKYAKPKALSKADIDTQFDKGSIISKVKLSESKILDLAVLGKVWGFLKYHHPEIASGNYNWDYELFRIMPSIIAAKTVIERNDILSVWIDKIGLVLEQETPNLDSEKVKISPDLAWINNEELGEQLTQKLNKIKTAKRKSESYYIGFLGSGNPDFKNEKSYSTMKFPDAGFRLLSLYRYWNMIHYYFPYKNLIEDDWNGVLKEFIPKFSNAGNELEYKQTALALIARIHDTHANIWDNDQTLERSKGLNFAPLEINFVENKAIVIDYFDKDLGEKTGLKIGDEIVSINGKKVEDIVKEMLPLTPASNYPTQLRDISRKLLRTNDSTLNIEYSQNNLSKSTNLSCYNLKTVNIYKKYQKKDTCFKFINTEIAYLNPGNVKNQYFKEILPLISKTKGLVIDFRSYPSDFIVFSLSEFLLPEKKSFVKFSKGSVTSPGLFTINKTIEVGKNNKDYYKGKVVILINETTQSSAEYHTMAFRTAPKATVIGSTTAGADGDVSRFYLPGGISTMISGIGVYYPDGRETQRVGIIPNIEIKPTIKGIKEGKDELLEKAIEIINQK